MNRLAFADFEIVHNRFNHIKFLFLISLKKPILPMKFITPAKNIAFIILALVSFIIIDNAPAQWVQTNGPYGGYQLPLAANGSNIFAGRYRSTNNGVSWTSMNVSQITAGQIYDFASMGTDLYTVTGYGVYRTTNNGTNWIDISPPGIPSSYASSIGISGSTIYVGSHGVIYISTNNGANWTTSTNNLPSDRDVFAILPAGANVLISCYGKMYRSTNSGANWNAVAGMQTRTVNDLLLAGSNYFAATDTGVFISTNAGADWQRTGTGLSTLDAYSALTYNGTTLFTGGQRTGIYKSTNNGALWTPASGGLRDSSIQYMLSSGADVFAESGKGVFKSTDNGVSWFEANTGIVNKDAAFFASIGNNIFVGSSVGGDVYRSSDEGLSWQNVSASGLGKAVVRALVAKGSNLFVSIVANDTTQGIYKSTNNGANWSRVYSSYAAVMAVSTDKIYAGLYNGFISSTNDGASWQNVNIPNPNFGISYLGTEGNTVIAGRQQNYLVSTNNGLNWTTGVYPASGQFNSYSIGPNNIWAIASGKGTGLYRSTNQGANFSQVSVPGLAFAVIENNGSVFVSSDSGVYRSTNNGITWIKRNQGMPIIPTNIYYSTIVWKFYLLNNTMFAGTIYSAVWKAPLSYLTGVKTISTQIPGKFSLQQNYPNPFNPSTKISFSLPVNSFVKLSVYNLLGREVANLVNEKLSAGSYAYDFNGEVLSSGVYYYKMETENFSETKKMVLLK
jgi:photosystem II stability/assembly factor-like uncharacterized protein